jgi:hypothetical protein
MSEQEKKQHHASRRIKQKETKNALMGKVIHFYPKVTLEFNAR